MSIERYLSVRIKSWRICWFNSRKAVYLSVVIGTILFVLHFHMLFTNGYNSIDANGTVKVFCYESLNSTVFPAWQEVCHENSINQRFYLTHSSSLYFHFQLQGTRIPLFVCAIHTVDNQQFVAHLSNTNED